MFVVLFVGGSFLTSYVQEPPPEKKVVPKPSKNNKQYGGPGSFVPSGELPSRLASDHGAQVSRIMSTSGIPETTGRDPLPSSLRASNSLAKLDLYMPPYERSNGSSAIDRIANDFGELRVPDLRRRESFPVSCDRCIYEFTLTMFSLAATTWRNYSTSFSNFAFHPYDSFSSL
jgi:hypothetical protein